MKYFNFLIVILAFSMLFMTSCDSDGEDSPGQCSIENINGECKNSNQVCDNGVCVDKVVECNPECTDEQVCNNGTCIESTKEVDCNDAAPENASSTVAKVTVEWNTDTKDWNETPNCVWECDANFKKNLVETACIAITDSCATDNGGCAQICTDNAGTAECSCEAGYVLSADNKSCSDIDECLTDNGGCGDAVANKCINNIGGAPTCECEANYHAEADNCVSNTKLVNCVDNSPANANATVVEVSVNWVNNAWETAADCAFICNAGYAGDTCVDCATGYHADGDTCVEDTCINDTTRNTTICGGGTQPEKCVDGLWVNDGACNCDLGYEGATCTDIDECLIDNGGCGNAVANKCINNIGGAPTCECEANYHTENNSCVSNTKQVDCLDNSPATATATVVQVSVNWVNDAWETATDCAFTCNAGYVGDTCADCDTGYHADGQTCVIDTCVNGNLQVGTTDCGVDANGDLYQECIGGVWVDQAGVCECGTGYAGDDCNNCDLGYWGATCTACPGTCDAGDGHGICNDSDITATSACYCDDGYEEVAGVCVLTAACTNGDIQVGTTVCGANDNGLLYQECIGNVWVDDLATCECTGNYKDGVGNEAGLCNVCNDGYWGATCENACPGTCDTGDGNGMCNDGDITATSACFCADGYEEVNEECVVVAPVKTVDWCNTQWPETVNTNDTTVYGRVYIDGVTTGAGEGSGVTAELCYFEDSQDYEDATCVAATYNTDNGDDDEYQAVLNLPADGTYHYYYQFKNDGDTEFSLCDLNNSISSTNGTAYNNNETYQGDMGEAVITSGAEGNLIISEVVDNPNSNARYLEVYADGGDVNLNGWKIKLYANANATSNTSYTFPDVVLTAGSTFVVASNVAEFTIVYGFAPDNTANTSAVVSNGDDNFELVDSTDTVIDVYGVPGTDGSGFDWEMVDSGASRNLSVSSGNTTWTASEWTITAGTAALTPGVR